MVLYHYLKILHIILGSGLFGTLIYSGYLVYSSYLGENRALGLKVFQKYSNSSDNKHRILCLTLFLFLPLAIIELILGTMIISIKNYAIDDLWVKGTFITFALFTCSWLTFIFSTLYTRYTRFEASTHYKLYQQGLYKFINRFLFILSISSLLGLLFFMSTRIVT